MGIEAYYEGDWEHALELYERSRALRERLGDVTNVAMQTSNIGEILSDQGHLEEAERLFTEVERICDSRRSAAHVVRRACQPRPSRRARGSAATTHVSCSRARSGAFATSTRRASRSRRRFDWRRSRSCTVTGRRRRWLRTRAVLDVAGGRRRHRRPARRGLATQGCCTAPTARRSGCTRGHRRECRDRPGSRRPLRGRADARLARGGRRRRRRRRGERGAPGAAGGRAHRPTPTTAADPLSEAADRVVRREPDDDPEIAAPGEFPLLLAGRHRVVLAALRHDEEGARRRPCSGRRRTS